MPRIIDPTRTDDIRHKIQTCNAEEFLTVSILMNIFTSFKESVGTTMFFEYISLTLRTVQCSYCNNNGKILSPNFYNILVFSIFKFFKSLYNFVLRSYFSVDLRFLRIVLQNMYHLK